MILVRAPLRITFIGDATDLRDFYSLSSGRVISATIDKFIYLLFKPTQLVNKFIVKYQTVESVSHPRELLHDRIRTALLDLGITTQGMEIGSFADIPAKTGLGSSSSFSVALMKGLYAYLGKTMSMAEAAEAACRLEIDLLREPIGKQDQYAAAFGGFNIFQFNPDETVSVESVLLDYKKRSFLKEHLLLFFTGLTRNASSVLTEQRSKIKENIEIYKKMADSVYAFHDALLAGSIEKMAGLVDEEWHRKKSLASNVTNPIIERLYYVGRSAGAWGGKVMGAGDGGCILFFVPPKQQAVVREGLSRVAQSSNLMDFQEIPFEFMQSGTDILFNSLHR